VTGPAADRVQAGLKAALSGTYRVEREFARGAMARLFLAQDLRHDRTVVVKVLPPETATAQSAERFLREIRITAVLQHPNILPLIDSGAAHGLCWYVMPYVEGISLRDRLKDGPFPVRDAFRIAIAVAQALEYARQHGVIHRDIKPENILFSGGQPMVADFGLARAVAGTQGAGITATGLPLGTPAYMSPEQATGSSDIDHRSDLYGLGCILFELLTGRPPFTGRSVMDVIRHHMEATPPPVSSLRSGLVPATDALVAKLLQKKPADRYQSAQDLLVDLENAMARETVDPALLASTAERASAQPPPPPPPAAGSWFKRLWPVGVLLLGIAGVWFARFGGGGAGGAGERLSVAVLPFDAAGGDSVALRHSERLADEIVAELLRRGSIRVVSPISSGAMLRRGHTARTIGDSLGVRYLFGGLVTHAGGQIHIRLELTEASGDAAAWVQQWDHSLAELQAARPAIAVEAADALLRAAR